MQRWWWSKGERRGSVSLKPPEKASASSTSIVGSSSISVPTPSLEYEGRIPPPPTHTKWWDTQRHILTTGLGGASMFCFMSVFTRLKVERTREMKEALHDFVDEVHGRPYKLNPLELWRALRTSNDRDNISSIFCSQLVAAAFQRMGLLSTKLSSNNYLPVDFADKHLRLLKGRLEQVMVIAIPPRRRWSSKNQHTATAATPLSSSSPPPPSSADNNNNHHHDNDNNNSHHNSLY